MAVMKPDGECVPGESVTSDQSNGVASDDAAPTVSQGVALSVGEHIRLELLSWPGVTDAPHRFGGVAFHLGRRELGHLHGDYLADFPFPTRVRDQLVREGRAQPHHVMPHRACVSYYIDDAQDLPGVLALFRLAYKRAVTARNQHDRRAAAQMERIGEAELDR